MHIEQHREVKHELRAAITYLEEEWFGLGERFLASFHRVVGKITAVPDVHSYVLENGKPVEGARWAKLDNNMRYKVIFKHYPERELIYIVAVAHFRQRPHYWKERLKDAK